MKKLIKKSLALLVLVLCIFQLSAVALANVNVPSATNDFYVNDFAGLFTSEEKSRLMDNAVELSNEYDGIQVVITTLESLDGNTVESYATQMYNQYVIGKDDMGILVLLSVGDRQIRVEVGKAMEAYINDSKAGKLMDTYAIPYLKDDKFSEGLISLQEAIISEITTCIDEENASITNELAQTSSVIANEELSSTSPNNSTNTGSFIKSFVLAVLFISLVIIIGIVVSARKKKEYENIELNEKLQEALAALQVSKAETSSVLYEAHETNANYEAKILSLTKQNQDLQDKLARVEKLHPSIDAEISAMIEQEIRERDIGIAREVDEKISSVLHQSASRHIIGYIRSVLGDYSSLNANQQSYIQSDIAKLRNLLKDSEKLQAEYEEEMDIKAATSATEEILAITSLISVGRAKDLRNLRRAKSIYESLISNARAHVSDTVIDNLDRLLREAKRDQDEIEEADRRRREEEEEERRRRQSLYSHTSSSSFGGSSFGGSHFGGFGGRSGGGGASRGF